MSSVYNENIDIIHIALKALNSNYQMKEEMLLLSVDLTIVFYYSETISCQLTSICTILLEADDNVAAGQNVLCILQQSHKAENRQTM